MKHFTHLTGLLVAATLVSAAPAPAFADRTAPIAAIETNAPSTTIEITDAARYRAREAAAPASVADFHGGSVTVIGVSTLTILLVVIIVLLIL